MLIIFYYVGPILGQHMVLIIMLCTFQPLLIYIFDNKKQHQRRYKRQRYQPARHRKTHNLAPLMACSVVPFAATNTKYRTYLNIDTDSGPVGIDNTCSACISHCIGDFQGSVTACNRSIKGFGGTKTHNVQKGTIQWDWLDDEGTDHTFTIPDSYYVPEGKVRLLSLQHWDRTQCKHMQTREMTDATSCTLSWGADKHQLTVPLDYNNVATFHLAPGYSKFDAFCAEAKINEDYVLHCEAANLISDDEEEETAVPTQTTAPIITTKVSQGDTVTSTEGPTMTDFNINGPTCHVIHNYQVDEEDRQDTTNAMQMLRYHQQFGHVSMKHLQEMAKQGIIPLKFSKIPLPVCSACLFAKLTKKPWRQNHQRRTYHHSHHLQNPVIVFWWTS